MAARKLGSASRHLSIEERVNIAEGEDVLTESDDDGLDMIKDGNTGEVSFDKYLDAMDVGRSDIIDDSAEHSSSDTNKRKRTSKYDRSRKEKKQTQPGERVGWDDDEDSDAAYTAFKKRKSEQRKKTIASTKRVAKKLAGASLVGKRSKTVRPIKDGKERKYGGKSDDENDLMETTLPNYLQDRHREWEKRKQKLGDMGLRSPPDYDDIDFSDDERLEDLKERPKLPSSNRPGKYEDIDLPLSAGRIPAPIAQYLRKYQVEGAEFLHKKFVYQEGGILGDDMGLGKTIQVIAFLTAAFGKTGDERDHKRMRKMRRMPDKRWYPRILIICPGSLMSNWRSELDRWGYWHIGTYHGAGKRDTLERANSGRLEIMITTYQTYRLDQGVINDVRWDCVIADECHIIKEKKAEITKAMNEVNALCRIGLTGTAIQNKYEELWTLLNWTNPGRLGPMIAWKQAICVPLKLGQSYDATNAQLAKARRTAVKLRDNLLPNFFKRRTKKMIADELPQKSDRVVFCPMTETQADAYNNFCDSELVKTIRNASQPCTCNSGKKQGWCCYTTVNDCQPWQNFVFPVMVTLQKLSSHVALLLPSGESDKEKHDKDIETLQTALPDTWRDLYRQRDSILNYANTSFCGKWRILRKMLRYWHDHGDKVLIFSYSVRLLKMLNMLFKATTSYNVSYLDGSLNYDDRQKVVDDYNSDPRQFVFLISTKAGGVGLNITSANKVVVVDPNWNPSYDLQAQDRAYRIGQTRDVQVFRLVSVGTIEECIYARQIYKQQQANIGYNASVERRYFKGVQGEKEQKGEIFGLANMFAPLSDNIKLRDIVNNTNIAETRAGVEIAGLDLEASQDEDEDGIDPLLDEKEDAAMSQLAADIIDEPAGRRKAAAKSAKKKDAVQAILASAGVEYTHENAEVIGTSRVERLISSRAQNGAGDLGLDTDYAFARGLSQVDAVAPVRSRTRTPNAKSDTNGNDNDDVHDEYDDIDSDDLDAAGGVRYMFRPPPDVLRRQFCTMAKKFGYDDVTEFALVVEGWTQEQRRDCLDKFYKQMRGK